MCLIERKPTLSDFFGIAVNTTSRQASGLSVSHSPKRTRNKRYSHTRVDQLRARTISTTTPSDPGCLHMFCTCQSIGEVMELQHRRLPACINLTLCQVLKTDQTLMLNIHIVVIVAIDLTFTRSSSPRVSVRRGTIRYVTAQANADVTCSFLSSLWS